MDRIEVLVAAMNQKDESLYYKMNLRTDAIIANQCDKNEYKEYKVGERNLKMISTTTKGVGKNRNFALLHATGDILLFADEDMVYYDDYEEIIKKAFSIIPNADVIIFQIENRNPKSGKKITIDKVSRLHLLNSLKYGAVRIAVKRESLLKANIWFSLLFGGGAKYCSGEDTIFIRDCFKKRLKVYSFPESIAVLKQEDSTWFTGFNEKYFLDRGALLASIFPIFKILFAFIFAIKYRRLSPDFNYHTTLKLLFNGIFQLKERGFNT